MKKEKFNQYSLNYKYGFIAGAILVGIILGLIIGIIYESYNNLQSEYYNYRAKAECPMMQYESGEFLAEYNATKERVERLTNATCIFIEKLEKGLIASVWKCQEAKYFTTGRYIDGEIECLAEPERICIGQIIIHKDGSYECPYKEKIEYQKSQKFTLEEMGFK